MRRRWCWSGAEAPAGALAAALLAAMAAPAGAATVLDKSVTVDIRPDGTLRERTRLSVRLDDARDHALWSPYPILLDENRTLASLAAAVVRPDGSKSEVGRKGLDTVSALPGWVLHSSQSFRTVTFPAAPVGSVLSLDYEVEERPYFRSGTVALAGAEPIERLEVVVRGGGAGWRWKLDGALPGVSVRETAGGVTLAAERLPAVQPPDLAPADAPAGAVLRYAWGEERDWAAVGRWYQGLLAQVPRADESVRRRARELIAGVDGRRERLAALADFARRQVRYVAVEVGIGGYRPFAPAEVLGRGWGDCKDKAVLLVDLLREAGIEAYPALIRAGEEGRLDRDFPAVDQFNHVIVAVPAAGLDPAPDDPVAGGYLFIDATQTLGGLRWLSPWVQDQDALVVRDEGAKAFAPGSDQTAKAFAPGSDQTAKAFAPGSSQPGGELVRTPIRQDLELRQAEVDLAVDAAGNARGEARVAFSGRVGASLVDLMAAGPPEPVEALARQLFSWFFPGVSVTDLRWSQQVSDLPSFSFAAKIELPALLQRAGDGAAPTGPVSLSLPGEALTPSPSLLAERTLPVVAAPGRRAITWRLRLPAGWCPVKPQEDAFENALGSFRQTVAGAPGTVVIERSTVLANRWIDPAAFPALKDLALAEHRGMKRRVRLECGEAK